MKRIKLSIVITAAVIITGSLLAYLIFDINKTKRFIAQSLIEKSIQNVTISLNGFFNPIKNALLATKDQATFNFLDEKSNVSMNNYFVPMIKHYPQLSYMGIGTSSGYEINVIPNNNKIKLPDIPGKIIAQIAIIPAKNTRIIVVKLRLSTETLTPPS